MASPNSKGVSAKQGYALPAVLTVVSILTLVFITAIAALKSLADETRAAVDATEFQRAAMTAEAHAAFLAVTEPLGPDRLRVGGPRISPFEAIGGPVTRISGPEVHETPVYMDDTPYDWTPAPQGRRYRISFQDAAGLMNLDFSRSDAILRILALAGTDRAGAERIADQLLDAIDADDDRRINGAEASDYARIGRPPPPNAPLLRTSDIFGLPDWPTVMNATRWRRISRFVVADPGRPSFNINTAPAEVLSVVLSLTDAQARDAVARRRIRPFTSIADLGFPEGDALINYIFPADHLRLTVVDPRRGLTYQSTVYLTPNSPDRPFWVENVGVAALPLSDLNTADPSKSEDGPRFPDPLDRPAGV